MKLTAQSAVLGCWQQLKKSWLAPIADLIFMGNRRSFCAT